MDYIKKNKKLVIIIGCSIAAVSVLTAVILTFVLGKKQGDKEAPANSGTVPTEMAAGSGEGNVTLTPGGSGDLNPTEEATPTPAPTGEPLEEIGKSNPLGLTGYTYFDDDEPDNDYKDLFLKATIETDAKVGDEYLWGCDVFLNGDSVFFDLHTCAISIHSEDFAEELHNKYHAGYISSDGKVSKKETDADLMLCSYGGGKLITVVSSHDKEEQIVYGEGLEELGKRPLPDVSGVTTSDGERTYYIEQSMLFMCDSNGEKEEIKYKDKFWGAGVNGVITDESGTDYALLYAQAGDMNWYNVLINASTGETAFISSAENSGPSVSDSLFYQMQIDENYDVTGWLLAGNGFSYDVSNGEEYAPEIRTVPGGYILLTQNLSPTNLKLFLYKAATMELIDSTELEIPYEADNEYGEVFGLNLVSTNWISDGEEMLLLVQDNEQYQHFYKWNVSNPDGPDLNISFKEHKEGSIKQPVIENKVDFSKYTPSEVSDKLLPLREKADEIEEKYGVEILIGEECANIIGGYAISPLTDYELTEEALEVFDEELEKYPKGFFEQLNGDSYEGNVFYIAGELKGIQGDVLDTAGGFQCDYEGSQLIVFDATTSYQLHSTIHHEICHSIEDYITQLEWDNDAVYLDDDKWYALNPGTQDCYTYNYGQYGYEGSYVYSYETLFYDGNIADAYFVDNYAMTYPSEDMARIFESAMSDELYDIDFNKSPHLKAKLSLLSDAIQAAFDTTGWGAPVWESALGN